MVTCGAKTRSGEPCKKAAIMGKKRCRNHGGASTGAKDAARPGNSNALKHGFYSDRLSIGEMACFEEALSYPVTLDDEIALARLMLCRVLRQATTPEHELLIEKFIDTIRKLELARSKLGQSAQDNDQFMESIMRDDTFIL